MKTFNKKRLIISGTFMLLVIVLLIIVSLDVFTYSRYETVLTSQNSITTAVYLLEDEYQTINVKLPDVMPSNRQYTYTFSVSNFNEDLHADTNLKYHIHIRTPTNMEIEYQLYNTLDIASAESDILSNSISPDNHGTYFRNILTRDKTMLYSEDKTDYYTILFTFPSSFSDAKYSGVAELIEINIISNQILASDN